MVTKLFLKAVLAIEAAFYWLLLWAKAYQTVIKFRQTVGEEIHLLNDDERKVLHVLAKAGLL